MSYEVIRERAEVFRRQYCHDPLSLPIPVDEIIEFDLGINVIPTPGLRTDIDIDGYLSKDMKSIYIDSEYVYNDRFVKRYRFTLAHELGHYVLHEDKIKLADFDTEDRWLDFRKNLSEDNLSWFEFQAHEFAGRLLVPVDLLKERINGHRDKIESFIESIGEDLNLDLLIGAVSRLINEEFGVSDAVIKKRIKKENIEL